MGQFQEGNPGRPKGSKNKFKLTTIQEALRDEEIDLGPLIVEEIMAISNRIDRITLLLRLYAWVEPRVQKIQNIGERPSEVPSLLSKTERDNLLEVLQPDNASHG